MPRDVSWRGRSVHTGIWKRPVEGRCTLRRLNLDGDGQGDLAGHGGEQRAVFVYQLGSYDHWRRELGRDDLRPGHFGENFTVDGLPDDEVRIGDRYRVGSAVVEVTQPRVTCYRVGLRLDDPRIPALLVSHRRPGFYLRVLTEGEVAAGDTFEQVASGPEGMTVAAVDALLYLPGPSREQVARAAAIPALSPGWRASFTAMLADTADTAVSGNAGLGPVAPAPAWPGFRPLQVTAVAPESATVTSFHLADPAGTALPAPLPGQFLTLRLPMPDGAPLLRSYSLSGPPAAPDYRISVHREPGGAGSGRLHTAVRPGDVLDTAAPRGTFVLQPSDAAVLLISAGIGVTPVLAMLHALAAGGSPRELWWLHTARDAARHPFAAEADALLARLPRAHRHVRYTSPRPGDHGNDATGRLSLEALAALAPPRDAEAYLCGPPSFIEDLTAALVELGLAPARVHRELFSAAPAITPGIAAAPAPRPHPPDGAPGTGPPVAFARSRLSVNWGPGYGSLLELAEACDVPVRWSCRTGVCQTCRTALLSGSVRYDPSPVEPAPGGDVLICSAQPAGEVVLDL
nr:MOSC and FAD-binding oxidoreductase domain-containing protein [Pseudonocardia acidicola]